MEPQSNSSIYRARCWQGRCRLGTGWMGSDMMDSSFLSSRGHLRPASATGEAGLAISPLLHGR